MVTPETKPMVTPVEAVKQGFRKYVDFGGRATRAEYWWWVLFTILAGIVLSIIDSIIGFSDPWDYGPLYTLFVLATLLPSLAVAARRLHDIGKTGWWQLAWYAILFTAWIAAGIMFLVGAVIVLSEAGTSASWSSGQKGIVWENEVVWENVGQTLAFLPAAIMLLAAFLITLAIIVWSLVWLARRGEPGQNRFGPDPRALDAPELPEAA
jgi:uncharacterized membrane protein YhaH (DUF805 family)